MSTSRQPAVCLLSGGLDSVVAAALWLEAGHHIALCLTFDYQQRAYARECAAAERFARARGLEWRSIRLDWLGRLATYSGSALTAAGGDLPSATVEAPGDADSAQAVWVPARNAVFASVAVAHAEAMRLDVVLAGFNREEAATFADNSQAFVDAGNAFFALGTRRAVRLASPTQELDKVEIVDAASRLGIERDSVWSCYRGDDEPCGRCESCARSARAWACA